MTRWSLRNLLIATAILPLAVYMLVKANAVLAGLAILFAFGTWVASMVIALSGKGERRAVASGVLVAMTIYGAVVLYQGKFTLTGSKLVTSGLLYYVHEACVTRTTTSEVVDSNIVVNMAIAPAKVTVFKTEEMPIPEHFAIVGHVYWSFLFGTVCGWLACWASRWEPSLPTLRPIRELGEARPAK